MKIFNKTSFKSFFISTALFFAANNVYSAAEESVVASTNFSFASYLGTGFYSTSGQDVFVVQLPFEFNIREKTNTEAGWVLKLPLTFGVINFGNLDIEDLPDINDITTLTFLPGIEYQYPVTQNWTISPFVDYGFAHDFNNSTNILVSGIGIKSYYNIPLNNARVSIGNRFLYARERNNDANVNSDYSLVETGINYRITSNYTHNNGAIFGNLYYINFYYPNNLVFLENTDNPVRVGIEHEVGITLSNLPDIWLFESPQLGFGVRFGNGVDVYRFVIGMPF